MKTTNNLGLKKIELTDSPPDITVQDFNWDIIDNTLKEHEDAIVQANSQLAQTGKAEKAGGSATAITLINVTFTDGSIKNFIAKANNNAAATTINGKPLYRPGTTTAPKLKIGVAVAVWYDAAGDCFFVKASTEGDAVAANVLAGKIFSNEEETGIEGTIPSKAAQTFTPTISDQEIAAGQYLSGKQTIKGDANLVPSKVLLNNTIFGVTGTGVGVKNCAQISGLAAQVGFSTTNTVVLNWVTPSDGLIKGLRIVAKTGSYPANPTDGTLILDTSDGTIPATLTTTALADGGTYYIRTFAYTYQNATRIYTTTTTGAQCTASPLQVKGIQTFTSSGVFTVPAGVISIDIFCVGGGGGGDNSGGNGGGGGFTTTKKSYAVTAGQTIAVTIGAGGAGGINGVANSTNGGTTSFGSALNATGGSSGAIGSGGSGGGKGSPYGSYYAGAGGSNGGNGGNLTTEDYQVLQPGGSGQGTTTRAFADASNTLYSGGGGGGSAYPYSNRPGGSGGGGDGGYNVSGGAGGANTGGGGGGGGAYTTSYSGGFGGSGICIVRWGY